jgi:hypothetical protein
VARSLRSGGVLDPDGLCLQLEQTHPTDICAPVDTDWLAGRLVSGAFPGNLSHQTGLTLDCESLLPEQRSQS